MPPQGHLLLPPRLLLSHDDCKRVGVESKRGRKMLMHIEVIRLSEEGMDEGAEGSADASHPKEVRHQQVAQDVREDHILPRQAAQ